MAQIFKSYDKETQQWVAINVVDQGSGGSTGGLDESQVNTLIDNKLNPVSTQVNTNTSDISTVKTVNNLQNSRISTLESNRGTMANLATTDKTSLVNAINETFQSVSNGKTLVANAITDKGVATQPTDTFATMAMNITNIPTSGGGTGVEEIIINPYDANSKYRNYPESRQALAKYVGKLFANGIIRVYSNTTGLNLNGLFQYADISDTVLNIGDTHGVFEYEEFFDRANLKGTDTTSLNFQYARNFIDFANGALVSKDTKFSDSIDITQAINGGQIYRMFNELAIYKSDPNSSFYDSVKLPLLRITDNITTSDLYNSFLSINNVSNIKEIINTLFSDINIYGSNLNQVEILSDNYFNKKYDDYNVNIDNSNFWDWITLDIGSINAPYIFNLTNLHLIRFMDNFCQPLYVDLKLNVDNFYDWDTGIFSVPRNNFQYYINFVSVEILSDFDGKQISFNGNWVKQEGLDLLLTSLANHANNSTITFVSPIALNVSDEQKRAITAKGNTLTFNVNYADRIKL